MRNRRTILAVAISVLALVALGVSSYLTWVTWQSETVAGCTTDSLLDCDEVLSSRWSKWFGLPVSLLGGVTYFFILFTAWLAVSRSRDLAMTTLFSLTLLAAGAAVWFIGLQAFEVRRFCYYCLTVHSCGLVIAVLAFFMLIDSNESSEFDQMRNLLGVAEASYAEERLETSPSVTVPRLFAALATSGAGLALLMSGQLLSVPSDSMEEVKFPKSEVASETAPSEDLTKAEVTKAEVTEAEVTEAEVVDSDAGDSMAIVTDRAPEESPGDEIDWLDDDSEETSPLTELLTPAPLGLDEVLSGGSSRKRMKYQALSEPVDVTALPMLGSPQAEHIMIEMMDYTCHHCRKLHPHLHAALERYGDQLGIVIHHVPLSKKCNPHVTRDGAGKSKACDYAQLAIGVWKLSPEKFSAFHHWLLESEKPPNIFKARQRAVELVGNEILLNQDLKSEGRTRLAEQSSTLKRLNTGLPILLFVNGALRGVPDHDKKLFDYLEAKLGVEPR